jgi:hypothetical protein
MAQLAYTQNVLNQFSGGSLQSTPRGRSTQSARSRRIIQSQVQNELIKSKFLYFLLSQQHIEHVHEVLLIQPV